MYDHSGVYHVCKQVGLALNQRGVHPQLNLFALMDLWYTVEPQIQWSYFYFTIVIIAVNVYFESIIRRASWQNPQQNYLYGPKSTRQLENKKSFSFLLVRSLGIL